MRKFKAIPGKGIVAATKAESKTDLTHALDNIDKSDYVGDEDGDPILYSGLKWVGGVGVIDADGGKFRLMHFFGDPTHQTNVEYLENDYKTEEAAKKAGRDYLKKIAKNKESVESAKKIKAGCHGKKKAVEAADDEYKNYEVTVRFVGIGCEETYDVIGRNERYAENSALGKAAEDLYAEEINHIEDDEYEVTVNFNGFIGCDETYTVYADSEDEAEELGIDAAIEDLEVIDIVEGDTFDLDKWSDEF